MNDGMCIPVIGIIAILRNRNMGQFKKLWSPTDRQVQKLIDARYPTPISVSAIESRPEAIL